MKIICTKGEYAVIVRHCYEQMCCRGTAPGCLEMREDDACTRWGGKKDDDES